MEAIDAKAFGRGRDASPAPRLALSCLPLLLTLIVSGCAPTPIVVTRDTGGNIIERIFHVEKLRHDEQEVRILGDCWSACTFYLSLEKVCVSPNARFGFHRAVAENAGQIDLGNTLIAEQYSPKLKALFHETYSRRRELTFMSGKQIHEIEGVPLCAT